jgi:sugar lactone lactonase YvrE
MKKPLPSLPNWKTCLLAGVLFPLLLSVNAQAQIINTLVAAVSCYGIALDKTGTVYFTSPDDNRVRKVDAAGVVTIIAGTGTSGHSGDGGPATAAEIGGPEGITIDGAGNLFICETYNNYIRRIDAAGIITTVAGNGTPLETGDGGPATAAGLLAPGGLAIDVIGNLYLSSGNGYNIRKIDAAGIITRFAGNGTLGYSGDGGPATAAQLHIPWGIIADGVGNIYFTDGGNNAIRKVNGFGIISTVAGTGIFGFSGDGGPATAAKLHEPSGIAIDAAGTIFFNDTYNNRVRKITPAGVISTIAGTGGSGYSGDGGPALLAQFMLPIDGLAIDCGDNLYVADDANFRLRVITYTDKPAFLSESHTLMICENSGPASINALLAIYDTDALKTIDWSLLLPPAHGSVAAMPYSMLTTGDTTTPVGLTYTPATGYTGMDSFRVAASNCGPLADTVTVYVSINPYPVVSAITGKDSLCVGKTITFSDATSGGAWSAGGGASVSATGAVTGTTAGAGTVSYTVTTLGCSTAVGYAVTVVNCPNGVKAPPGLPEGEEVVSILPNPVKDELMVSNAAGSEVMIYNIMGQLSFDGLMMTSDKQVVNIKGLVPGTYIVRITGNGWARNFRVVKE